MAQTKIRSEQLNNADGWTPANETWTYASSSTFTIVGDKTSKYQKGDKIKITQTTVKYFYVISVVYSSPNTTITVTGGSDYSVANASITENYYSKQITPQGFPGLFAWTPGWSGFSANPTVSEAYFSINGRMCFIHINLSASGTSNATSVTITGLPVASLYTARGIASYMIDNGSAKTGAGRLTINPSDTSISAQTDMASGVWTNTGTKGIFIDMTYII